MSYPEEETTPPSDEEETHEEPLEQSFAEELFPESQEESAPDSEGNPDQIRIEALEAELGRTKEHMLRALAETENTRKRAQRERDDINKYAISAFAKDLLDFADNFRRALDAIPTDLKETADEPLKSVLSGLDAMEREMLSTLEKNHIRKLEPIGEIFNPNFHEVMFETPETDKPAGTIIQLIEPGYILHDRLLRPARVGVAKDNGSNTPSADDPGHKVDQEV